MGLEVALESDRLLLGPEHDGGLYHLRSVLGGVLTEPRVMGLEPAPEIAGDACVVPLGFGLAPEDVDVVKPGHWKLARQSHRRNARPLL